ncbi:MAG: 50S ribosomal protein L11 methyltransferase [Methanocella sp.]
MEWVEVTVTTAPEAVEAVAAKLEALGSAGVVVQDPELLGRRRSDSPLDLFPADLPVPDADRVTGYWPAGPEVEKRLAELRRFLTELPGFGLSPGSATLEVRSRAESEWAEAWKRFYHAQSVGRVLICPSWEECRPEPGMIVVDLDPGMAFGTGSHPTTALCLRALQDLVSSGEWVLDLGTGSGILAITAAKLGAEKTLAVDVDPVACRVAAENVTKNGVGDRVEVRQADAGEVLGQAEGTVDLILANLVADLIVPLAPAFRRALATKGRLLVSGITDTRWPEVVEALGAAGLTVLRAHEQEGWVALEAVVAP